VNDDYGTPWKDALTRYFPEFMSFYFPKEPNVFALVTAAHLLTQQTRGQHVQRCAAKWRLARLLYERNWDKQRVIDLFSVIDWMMWVPPAMQAKILSDLEDLERKLGMPYLNAFERRGLERGRQEALSQLLAVQMEKRFGRLPQPIRDRLQHATPDDLQRWGEALLDAASVDSVFASR
jgi:hypothetical protein